MLMNRTYHYLKMIFESTHTTSRAASDPHQQSNSQASSPQRPAVPKLNMLRPNTTGNHPIVSNSDWSAKKGTAENQSDCQLFSKLRSSSSTSTVGDLFHWAGSKEALLFIFHDNPQIGFTVASQISTAGNSMEVMLESKDDKGKKKYL